MAKANQPQPPGLSQHSAPTYNNFCFVQFSDGASIASIELLSNRSLVTQNNTASLEFQINFL